MNTEGASFVGRQERLRDDLLAALTLAGEEFEASACLTIVGPREELPSHTDDVVVVLNSAKPNPFNPTTQLSYFLPTEQFVRLSIYDVAGRLIECLVEMEQSAGEHAMQWDAGSHASGIYFYRLEADNVSQTKKMILLK